MNGLLFGRRLRFALVILASQILLIALAITWVIQMIVIAINGSVLFVEYNPAVLLFEIIISILICLLGIIVFIIQWRRLGERRNNDDTEQRASRERDS
jgi:membrane protein implicated in regulation of membrane protease activity